MGIYWGARIDGSFYQSCYSSPNNADVPFSGSNVANAALSKFRSHAGKNPTMAQWGGNLSSWPPASFNATAATLLDTNGMFSQYDWGTTATGLNDILANNATAKTNIGVLAQQIKNFARPVLFRPLWEMNGSWFSWGRTNYTAAQYVTIWRNLWQIFADVMGGFTAGSGSGTATGNASFFWCPNMLGTGTTADITGRFPGAAYVDWMGWDGYIGNRFGTTYKTPEQWYGSTYSTIAGLDATLPIGIGEWGVGHNLGSPGKSGFFTAMLDPSTGWLSTHPRIKHACYFNDNSFEAAADQSLCFEQNALGCPSGTTAPQTAFSNAITDSYYSANIVTTGTFPSNAKIPIPGGGGSSGGNDSFSSATAMDSIGGSFSATTVAATSETDEPVWDRTNLVLIRNSGAFTFQSTWFKLTAISDGTWVIGALAAGLDVNVYTGTTLANLVAISEGTNQDVSFSILAAQTAYVQVLNFSSGTPPGGESVASPQAFNISWISTPLTGGDDVGGPPLEPLEGFCVAFNADPLDSNPTWTRLDEQVTNGLSLQSISIHRGRPTERDKTNIGTMSASLVDTAGILDPTNPSSPYANLLEPIKPIGYGLRNPVTDEWGTLYRGFTADWNHDLTGLDRSGRFDHVEIECEDALAIISDAEIIPDTAGNTVSSESTGDVFYEGVTITKDRILAALADTATTFGNPYNGTWPADQLEIFTGNVKVKGVIYSSRTSLLQVIDDAADAEFPGVSNRFVSKDGKITFHGRLARFNPSNPQYHISTWNVGDSAAFAEDNTVAVITDLQFTRGKTNLINAALAAPTNIKDADVAGQFVSDASSVQTYGARSISFENLLTDGHSDSTTTDLQETRQFAQYFVDNYKNPRTRISQIVIRSQPPESDFGPNVWELLCGIDISDVVHVKTTHPGGSGGFDEDFFVEGISYEIVPMTEDYPDVTLTLDLSPKAYYDTSTFSGPLDIIDRILGSGAANSTFVGLNNPTSTARMPNS